MKPISDMDEFKRELEAASLLYSPAFPELGHHPVLQDAFKAGARFAVTHYEQSLKNVQDKLHSLQKEWQHEHTRKVDLEHDLDRARAMADELAGALKQEAEWLTMRGMLPIPEHIAALLTKYESLKK